MRVTNENKGITLVALIITMVVLLVIAGTAIYIGTGDIDKAKDQILLSELNQVQHFVGEKYLNFLKFKIASDLPGTTVSSAELQALETELGITLVDIPETYTEAERRYYRLTPQALESLGIQKCENTYVVNYLTGETINETKLRTGSGEILYSYSKNNFENNKGVTGFNQITTNQINSERDLFNSI